MKMRPGIFEILIIGIVFIGVLLAARIFGSRRREREEEEEEEEILPAETDDAKKTKKRNRFWLSGGVLVALAILMVLSLSNVIKWVFWGNIWAFVILIAGGVAIYLGWRSR
jgi:predicted histidine transporter YuiF (NhaC family)